MLLYSNYIYKRTLVGFFAFISIFISLIWFSRAISFVKYITENGIELSQFFYLFILILPWLLMFIIPISLFAAILLVYNRLNIDNEITILKNSGLTKIAICRPILSIALISSLFCYAISFYLLPLSNKELRISKVNFKHNYTNLSFNPKTFENLKNLTIYAKDRDENNNLYGILLHDERAAEYSMTITAKDGKIIVENDNALLYMENGTIQKFKYAEKKNEILNFDSYVFNLSENQKEDTSFVWKAKERYLQELLFPEPGLEKHHINRNRAELHQRFTYPLLPIILSMIALSCILKGSFSRRGSSHNIILAIMMTVIFLVLTISSYNAIESSISFTPLLYLNLIIFFVIPYKMLNSNYRKHASKKA